MSIVDDELLTMYNFVAKTTPDTPIYRKFNRMNDQERNRIMDKGEFEEGRVTAKNYFMRMYRGETDMKLLNPAKQNALPDVFSRKSMEYATYVKPSQPDQSSKRHTRADFSRNNLSMDNKQTDQSYNDKHDREYDNNGRTYEERRRSIDGRLRSTPQDIHQNGIRYDARRNIDSLDNLRSEFDMRTIPISQRVDGQQGDHVDVSDKANSVIYTNIEDNNGKQDEVY